jgi:hypothetical protein
MNIHRFLKSTGYVPWYKNESSPIYHEPSEIQGYLFNNLKELLEHQDDIICYSDCEEMEDVARYYIEETGMLVEVPANLQNYI